jgi:aspartyl-tRNA(Asn)/glutamyl-tRNA(Gln) amidotransferase subunit A
MIRHSAADMAQALAKKEVSAEELTKAHFERISTVDSKVKAFLHLDTEGAINAAKDVDQRRSRGENLPTLAGVPLALKDVMTQKGIPTTLSSLERPIWMSSPWAHRQRTLPSTPLIIPGI